MDDNECSMCGGSGELDEECMCGDDTCVCLAPMPVPCPECTMRLNRNTIVDENDLPF